MMVSACLRLAKTLKMINPLSTSDGLMLLFHCLLHIDSFPKFIWIFQTQHCKGYIIFFQYLKNSLLLEKYLSLPMLALLTSICNHCEITPVLVSNECESPPKTFSSCLAHHWEFS